VAALAVLARPKGRQWAAWLLVAAAAAAAAAAIHPGATPRPTREALTAQLDASCRAMVEAAHATASDPAVRRVIAMTGEAVDPATPFSALDRHLPRRSGLTLLLADDRGHVVAWAGEEALPPRGLWILGERAWFLRWSATRATLALREPILVEGRLAGSLLVLSTAPLEGRTALGLRAPRGWRLHLGHHPGALELAPRALRPVTVPVTPVPFPEPPSPWRWALWLAVGLTCLPAAPGAALVTALLLTPALLTGPDVPAPFSMAVALLGAAAVSRIGKRNFRRAPLATAVAAGGALALVLALRTAPEAAGLLPARVSAPGWGAVLALAAAWLLGAFPKASRWIRGSLGHRLAAGAAIALLLAGAEAVRLPLLATGPDPGAGPPLPRRPPVIEEILPAPPEECELDDLPVALARRWRLANRRTPTELRVLDPGGTVLGTWGALPLPPDGARVLERWTVPAGSGGPLMVELAGAAGPWSWLRDWSPMPEGPDGPILWAVLGRSGEVEATLHPGIQGLDPATAGDLFHSGEGWTLIQTGWRRLPARVERRQDALVARILRVPGPSVWAQRVLLAALWAVLGFALVLPPRRWLPDPGTFGGRLRILVAAGILVPLVLLTVVMREGLSAEAVQRRREAGSTTLNAVRWTLEHLAEGVVVDADLARSLADQTGAEVVLYDGPFPFAASRPDLLELGLLPRLPPPEAYARHLLGRGTPVLQGHGGRVVAAASVPAGGERILVSVSLPDPTRHGSQPGVADWLLTGAITAALLALALTVPVEERLDASLRSLIAAARRIQAGEPPGELPEPEERDLAEVVQAVRRMSEEVSRRERSLRHQEELLRITLATLEPAVLVLDASGSIRLTNPSADRLLEVHRDTVLDRVVQMESGRTGGEPVVRTLSPYPGRELTWRLGVASVPLPDGQRGTVAVVEDVTEVVRVDRLKQLAQLARIVAHEVKNPLTPIRLWVQEIEAALRRPGEPLESLVEEACREISDQVDRLQATSESFSNLVALERWEAGAVDVAAAAEEAVAPFRVVERHGIRLELDLPDPGTAVVTGDRQWIRRALTNLLRNSVDAVGEGPGWIRMSVRSDGDSVVITVEDSGGGVPEERLGELFEPHFSTTSGGSGLGLALVRMVAGRLGGTVEAVNGPEGLRVTLSLPARTGS